MTTLSNCSAGGAFASVSTVFRDEWTAIVGTGSGDKTLGRKHPKIDFVAAQSANGPTLHFSKRSSKMNKSGSGTASKMKYSATKPNKCHKLCVHGSILPHGIK